VGLRTSDEEDHLRSRRRLLGRRNLNSEQLAEVSAEFTRREPFERWRMRSDHHARPSRSFETGRGPEETRGDPPSNPGCPEWLHLLITFLSSFPSLSQNRSPPLMPSAGESHPRP